MRWSLVVLAVLGCHDPKPAVRPPPLDPVDPLLTAIETGDYMTALRVWCDGYAAVGVPCASTLRVELLEPTDVLSRMGDDHVVHMQPMPPRGGGAAYWDNWSKVLSNGAWHPQFAGDDEARETASTMLLTVLAHELGHHIAMRHGCHVIGAPGELIADELSTPLVQQRAHGRFGDLHTRMRRNADAMIAAVPEAIRVEVPRDVDVRAWAREHELPMEAGPYASLHLSRQRRLLEEAPKFTEAKRCAEVARTRLAQRIVEPGTVSTRGEWPAYVLDQIAIDRTGAVWAFAQDIGKRQEIKIRRVDQPNAPVRVATLPGKAYMLESSAASATRFLVSDGISAWAIARDGLAVAPIAISKQDPVSTTFAFDPKGDVVAAEDSREHWRVGEVQLALDYRIPETSIVDSKEWRDGPLATAKGRPWRMFAVGERIVFWDTERHALRAIGPAGVTTLAGSIEGRRDGASGDAQLFQVAAVAALADGTYAIAERGRDSVIVRIVTPRAAAR